MRRRRRIARLLRRLSRWIFGPYIDAWEPMTQAELDALIAETARDDGG